MAKEKSSGAAEISSTTNTTETKVEKGLDLSGFNYGDLQGDHFRDYCKMVAGLKEHEQFVFEVYKVEPIRQQRYEGVEGSPFDCVGFRIVDNKPTKTTKIPLKFALEFNGRLAEGRNFFTIEGGQWQHNGGNPSIKGEYYLLKK